jgi:hypothetical protein
MAYAQHEASPVPGRSALHRRNHRLLAVEDGGNEALPTLLEHPGDVADSPRGEIRRTARRGRRERGASAEVPPARRLQQYRTHLW